MHNRALVRPSWSVGAFKRRIVMSSNALQIIVEGKNYDGGFYGKIAESSALIRKSGYELIRVDTVYLGGGKSGVLQVFRELKAVGGLVQVSRNGPRIAVFAVDSDASGPTKKPSIINPHVSYTVGYDVESEIILNGSDVEALHCTLGISPAEARALAAALGSWHERAAADWREWIILCCLSARLGISAGAGFGRHIKGVDLSRTADILKDMEAKSGITKSEFEEIERDVRERVAKFYSRGHGSRLIKGKWLPHYLSVQVENYYHGKSKPDMHAFESKVVGHYLSTLNVNRAWSRRHRDRWERLLLSN